MLRFEPSIFTKTRPPCVSDAELLQTLNLKKSGEKVLRKDSQYQNHSLHDNTFFTRYDNIVFRII